MDEYLELAIILPLVFLVFLVSLIFLARYWKKRTEGQTTKLVSLFQIDYSCLKSPSTGRMSNTPSMDTHRQSTPSTTSIPSIPNTETTNTGMSSTPSTDTPSTGPSVLGRGNFSDVYLVYFHPTPDQLRFHKLGTTEPFKPFQPFRVAAKLLVPRIDPERISPNYSPIEELPTDQFEYRSIRSIHEELIIRKLEHENILRIFGLCRNFEIRHPLETGVVKRTVTVFEYMDLRDCKNFILDNRRNYTQLELYGILCSIFLDISNALVYLQGRQIVHRDIALRNIFLNSQVRSNRPNIIAKIGDFGLAREAKTKIHVIEKINRDGKEPTERLYSYHGCLRRENETLDESILPPESQIQTLPKPSESPDVFTSHSLRLFRLFKFGCPWFSSTFHFGQSINSAFFTSRSDIYCLGVAILECLRLIGSSEPGPGARSDSCHQELCDETAPVNRQVSNDITNYSSIQEYQGPSSSHQGHASTVCANTGTMGQLSLLAVLCMKPQMIFRISPEQLRDLLKDMLKKHMQPESSPPTLPQVPYGFF